MNDEELFERALRLPMEERSAFLDKECFEPDTRARVEAMLLEADSQTQSLGPQGLLTDRTRTFQEGSGSHSAKPSRSGFHNEALIDGRYQLKHPIGQGGMGTVWEADQIEPVRRRVAIKFIRAERGQSQAILSRFEAERQAIALMDHPNIAKLLDAGTADDGSPYFVMELVGGTPLTEFCDQHRLTISDRLRLFTQVCVGVQHAHQKGIIHRDLKPSNILVEMHDGKPIPKVIDFGLAKAMNGLQLTEKSIFTAFGHVLGTPLYMAPEQATFDPVDVDTRADIYALGVILYELLTGSTPITRDALDRAAYDEMLRLIREKEPIKPSSKLSTEGSASSVAALRQIEPSRLGRIVKGDLDWIVMKALSKERERRYETANGFAKDIERFLLHEPVLAGPPSTRYRLQKFVRRNRLWVTAGSLVTGALIVAVAGTSYGMFRAIRAERESSQRASELQKVSDYQAQMLKQIDAVTAGAEFMEDLRTQHRMALQSLQLTDEVQMARAQVFSRELPLVNATDAAVDFLDRAVLSPSLHAIDTQFADQPLVDASLRQTLGEIYHQLGRHTKALDLFQRAADLRTDGLGASHPNTIVSLGGVAISLLDLRHDDAGPAVNRLLEVAGELHDEDHPLVLLAQSCKARLLKLQSHFSDAENCLRDLLDRRTRVLGAEHPDTVSTTIDLANALLRRDQFEEAATLFRVAVDAGRNATDERRIDFGGALAGLAKAKAEMGQRNEAESLLREALEAEEKIHGKSHPNTLGQLTDLSIFYQQSGRFDLSEPLAKEALEQTRLIFGDEHRETLTCLNNVGMVYAMQGKSAETEPFWREAIETGRRILGDDHPDTLVWTNNFAGLLYTQGKFAEAESYFLAAYDNFRKLYGNEHSSTITALGNLGATRQEIGKLEEAGRDLREAWSNSRQVVGEDHPNTLVAGIRLGKWLSLQGDYAEAISILQPITEKSRQIFTGPNAARIALLLEGLGVSRAGSASSSGEFEASVSTLMESYELWAKTRGERHRSTLNCAQLIADAYTAWDRFEPDRGYDKKRDEWRDRAKSSVP